MEIWKHVIGYEGLYEVSSLGRVRRVGGKVLKPWRTRNGYIHATLFSGKSKKQVLDHRLVAKAFLEPNPGKEYINNKNCNPSDNRVENLEWVTQGENVKYAYDLGRAVNVARKKIKCLETGRVFYSSMEAATWVNLECFHDSRNLNTISRTIRQCANGDNGRTKAYGFKWRFCDDEGSTTIP